MKVIKVPQIMASWKPCAVLLETREDAIRLQTLCRLAVQSASMPSTKEYAHEMEQKLVEELKGQSL